MIGEAAFRNRFIACSSLRTAPRDPECRTLLEL